MNTDAEQAASQNTVRNLLVERAYRDALAIGQGVVTQGIDWNHEYVLKEIASEVRSLVETIEPSDVTQRYAHGLRLHALSLLFVTKLLEADARGEFDEVVASL